MTAVTGKPEQTSRELRSWEVPVEPGVHQRSLALDSARHHISSHIHIEHHPASVETDHTCMDIYNAR